MASSTVNSSVYFVRERLVSRTERARGDDIVRLPCERACVGYFGQVADSVRDHCVRSLLAVFKQAGLAWHTRTAPGKSCMFPVFIHPFHLCSSIAGLLSLSSTFLFQSGCLQIAAAAATAILSWPFSGRSSPRSPSPYPSAPSPPPLPLKALQATLSLLLFRHRLSQVLSPPAHSLSSQASL